MTPVGTVGISKRLAALRKSMTETGADLVVVAPSANMDWLIGFHPIATERLCLLIITLSKEVIVLPSLDVEAVRNLTSIPLFAYSDEESPSPALEAALAAAGAKSTHKIVFDETMRADHVLLVIDALPLAQRSVTTETIGALRTGKGAEEIARLKAIADINDRAMEAAFAAISAGRSELDIEAAVKDCFASHGAQLGYWVIGGGPNSAYPHHITGNRKLAAGDAIVIDIAGLKDGYYSDMTRMAALDHAPEGYSEVHAVVNQAVEAGIEAVRPGVSAKAVDAAARKVIADAGYGDFFIHRTGHGIGLEVHEPPYITASSETVLDEGMTFTIEPGIYLPGRFGIRLEEIVVVRKTGAEILSSLPRDLRIIPVAAT
jgi:Xaa-Pro aminopeptidase